MCTTCTRKHNAKVYREKLEYIDGVKLAAGCADCGYKTAAIALDFDHLPGFKKVGRIAALAGSSSLERIKEEIAKCEVVCSNCHRIRTRQRGQISDWWDAWRAGAYSEVAGVEDAQLSFLSADREVT